MEERSAREAMEEMKTLFDGFMVKAESFIEKQQEEKKVEEWPIKGGEYYYINYYGDIMSDINNGLEIDTCRMKNILIFKTKESCEKYYYIIDTINKIVDELGRPTLKDFEKDTELFSIYYDFFSRYFGKEVQNNDYTAELFFPWCKRPYIDELLKEVTQEDLLWAFKKSMRLV